MIRVRNDTGTPARIAACVDDAEDVGPGDVFDAQGVPANGALACLITPAGGDERCGLARRVTADRLVDLSQLRQTSTARRQ